MLKVAQAKHVISEDLELSLQGRINVIVYHQVLERDLLSEHLDCRLRQPRYVAPGHLCRDDVGQKVDGGELLAQLCQRRKLQGLLRLQELLNAEGLADRTHLHQLLLNLLFVFKLK